MVLCACSVLHKAPIEVSLLVVDILDFRAPVHPSFEIQGFVTIAHGPLFLLGPTPEIKGT